MGEGSIIAIVASDFIALSAALVAPARSISLSSWYALSDTCEIVRCFSFPSSYFTLFAFCSSGVKSFRLSVPKRISFSIRSRVSGESVMPYSANASGVLAIRVKSFSLCLRRLSSFFITGSLPIIPIVRLLEVTTASLSKSS